MGCRAEACRKWLGDGNNSWLQIQTRIPRQWSQRGPFYAASELCQQNKNRKQTAGRLPASQQKSKGYGKPGVQNSPLSGHVWSGTQRHMRRNGVRRGNAQFPALLLRIKPSSASSGNMPKCLEFNRVVVLLETLKSMSRNNSTRLLKNYCDIFELIVLCDLITMNVKLKRIEALLKNYRQIMMHIFLIHFLMCMCVTDVYVYVSDHFQLY